MPSPLRVIGRVCARVAAASRPARPEPRGSQVEASEQFLARRLDRFLQSHEVDCEDGCVRYASAARSTRAGSGENSSTSRSKKTSSAGRVERLNRGQHHGRETRARHVAALRQERVAHRDDMPRVADAGRRPGARAAARASRGCV